MTNTKKATILAGALAALLVLLFIALPNKDICADTIRGYKERANASIDIIRSGYKSLKGTLGTESVLEVPQIQKLDALNFSVLRACDTHCRLLTHCLRFVMFKPPSEACPQEYRDLKDTQLRAEGVLERLAMVGAQMKEAQAQVPAVQKARSDVQELEKAGGATGVRLALAQAKQRQLDTELSERLHLISTQLAELEKDQEGLR